MSLTCKLLGVSASGYFEHWGRKDAEKPSQPATDTGSSDSNSNSNSNSNSAQIEIDTLLRYI